MEDKTEEQREQRSEAVQLLHKATAILREIGDSPEDGIDSFVIAWTAYEPDERIDEHFYERLGKNRDVPIANEWLEEEEEEDCL